MLQEAVGQAAINELCRRDPLYWLTHWTKTRDDHWREKGTEPYAKFPAKPYFQWLFEGFRKERRLFVPKSRDMMVSWAVVGYLVWVAQWYGPAHIIIQTQKEDKACDLVSGIDVPGYLRTLYEQQEPWLQALHPTPRPAKDMAGLVFTWSNGSKIQSVPSGSSQIRQYHPSIVFFDEAAFLDDFIGSYGAAEPVATQIIAVSSAAPGDFGDIVLRVMDKQKYKNPQLS
ncbi:MAG: hypothetical protein ABSH52_20405 [Terriglobia bacterium]